MEDEDDDSSDEDDDDVKLVLTGPANRVDLRQVRPSAQTRTAYENSINLD